MVKAIKAFLKKLFGWFFWANLLGALLLVVAGTWLTFVFLGSYTHHGERINVPELKGTTVAEAVARLEDLGLCGEVGDTGFVRAKPAGIVLEQSIPAGQGVKSGRRILLTVNAAVPQPIPLPDVADNCSVREAETRLTILGFTLTPTTYISGEKDWVYEVKAGHRTLHAGERISPDTPLTLVVGRGINTDADETLWPGQNADSAAATVSAGTIGI